MAGIIIGQQFPGLPAIPVIVALFLLLSLGAVLLRKKYRAFFFVVFFAAFLVGYWRVGQSLSEPDARLLPIILRNERVYFTGIVQDVHITQTDRQRILLSLTQVETRGGVLESSVTILCFLPVGAQPVEIGNKLTLNGRLEHLRPPRSPGEFNEFRFWRSRKVAYRSFPNIIYVEEGLQNLNARMNTLRQSIAAIYEFALPPTQAGIAQAIILGDRGQLEEEIMLLFRGAGTYHILVVSGLHIALAGLMVQYFLRFFLKERPAIVIALLILVFYCLFTGASVSTVRATLMYGILSAGKLLWRPTDTITSVAFAATCLLLYEPLYLFDIGFQFSFAAVVGLVVGTLPLWEGLNFLRTRLLMKPRPKLERLFCSCLAAMLAITPVQMVYFHVFRPFSVFANMLIVPTLFITVIFGFVIGIIGLFHLPFAVFFSGPFFVMVRMYEEIGVFFYNLPYSQIYTGTVAWVTVVGMYCLYGAFLYFLHSNRREYIPLITAAVLLSGIGLVMNLW